MPASFATAATPLAKPKWVLDYAPSYCILSRARDGDQPGIAFRTRPLADEHDVLLFLPPAGAGVRSGWGHLYLGGFVSPKRWIASDSAASKTDLMVDTRITSAELERAAQAGSLRLSVPNKIDAAAALPDMAKALIALHRCEDDLATRWQVERGWVIPARPIHPLTGLFRQSDYPSTSVSRNNQGGVRVLLTISATGSVSACKIIESSGDPRLDPVPCRIFAKHAKFRPALDKNGRPIASSYIPPQVRFILMRR